MDHFRVGFEYLFDHGSEYLMHLSKLGLRAKIKAEVDRVYVLF